MPPHSTKGEVAHLASWAVECRGEIEMVARGESFANLITSICYVSRMRVRKATLDDASAMCRIYNEGIADRMATFETTPRTVDGVRAWFTRRHPIVVVEDDDGGVIAFASTSEYRPRPCYDGVAEFSVYVARDARRRGAGRAAMDRLIAEAREAGFWKLVSRVFVENEASRSLLKAVGFREVGTYHKHGRLDGVWRDTVIVERLL